MEVPTIAANDSGQSHQDDDNTDVMMFVEYLEPAHPGNRATAPWKSSVIPTWPHLKAAAIQARRYDMVTANAVESVHWIPPDSNQTQHFYAVLDSDRALWHERCEPEIRTKTI